MPLRLRRVSSGQWERLVAARGRYEPAAEPPRTQITAIELTLVELEERDADPGRQARERSARNLRQRA